MIDRRLTILKDIIIHPKVAFREIGENGRDYFFVAIAILVVSSIALSFVGVDKSLQKLVGVSTVNQGLLSSLVKIGFSIGGNILGVILLYYLGRAFKGKASFRGLFSALVYADIIPSVIIGALSESNALFALEIPFGIWSTILLILAFRETHGFSTRKSIAVLLIPVLIAAVIGGLVVLMLPNNILDSIVKSQL